MARMRRGQVKKKLVACDRLRINMQQRSREGEMAKEYKFEVYLQGTMTHVSIQTAMNLIADKEFMIIKLYENDSQFDNLVRKLLDVVKYRVQFHLFHNAGTEDTQMNGTAPTSSKITNNESCQNQGEVTTDIGDKKRLRWYLTKDELPELVHKMDAAVNQLLPTLRVVKPVLLESLGGCSRQQAHIHWPYLRHSIQQHINYGSMALSAILATHSNTTLDV